MPAMWPATLPQAPQIAGLTRQMVVGEKQSTMDDGTVKTMTRYTHQAVLLTLPLQFTGAQVMVFEAWRIGELRANHHKFWFEDTLTDQLLLGQFYGEQPAFQMFKPSPNPASRYWRATFQFLGMPT